MRRIKMSKTKTMLAQAAVLFACLMSTLTAAENTGSPKKPNIVLIVADDMSWADVGCYGNQDVKTPTLDALAKEGLRFTHCFTATAMCAPTRQQLYTGLFPKRNGAVANHTKVHPGTKSVVHHLEALGYTVALQGKTHFGPKTSFPFKNASLKKLCKGEKPFAYIFCSHNPHLPWTEGKNISYDPASFTIPPYLLDTPETRTALSMYYKEISALDQQVKKFLDILKTANKDQDTLVLFTSEQGSAFPRAKWTCYDMGLRTALIARWPGQVQAGTVTDAMVRYVDVVPTLVELAGGDPKTIDTGRDGAADGGRGFDGFSFADVLKGTKKEHAEWTYGIQTNPGVPLRSVRSKKYKYILNTKPGAEFTCKAWGKLGPKETLASWHALAKKDNTAKSAMDEIITPPKEMLFAIDKDPYEQNNLVHNPEYEQVLKEMREQLAVWMKQQADNGQSGKNKGKKK
ncbi:MAG TPA: sulfatase atsG [Opitutae bacterium]|nr:sulfatase atsG [Opitutae bacterium]HAF59258.1 sulfatase atsG [Opitutae bacterium]